MVYLIADAAEAGARILLCLKGEPYADYFERVCEEDGCDACEGAPEAKAAQCGFLFFAGNNGVANLFVGKELDAGIGKDSEEGG